MNDREHIILIKFIFYMLSDSEKQIFIKKLLDSIEHLEKNKSTIKGAVDLNNILSKFLAELIVL
jgi:5-methylcytosine-specific restriction endonuclease McrBC regulatory subunit McrC